MVHIGNFTHPELKLDIIDQYNQFIPDSSCFSWCLEQQVVHSNNLELSAVFLIFAAYIFIVLHSMDDVKLLKRFQPELIYMAKLMLIAFFVIYILVIRLRIYY